MASQYDAFHMTRHCILKYHFIDTFNYVAVLPADIDTDANHYVHCSFSSLLTYMGILILKKLKLVTQKPVIIANTN